jgi:hypothetical protein
MSSSTHGSARKRRPWLLIFNCQALGLGNCLNLLSDSIHVEAHDQVSFRQNADILIERIDEYEKILIAPEVEAQLKLDLGSKVTLWRIPSLFFHGYHPDLCVLSTTGDLSKKPLSGYHSIIAYAAFRCGLSEDEAVGLYCDDFYKQMGYYGKWEACRINFCNRMKAFGFDMERNIVEWSRRGPFMHSVNHPRIDCLLDYAKAILAKASLDHNDTKLLPMDNLINGPIFPIYKEIGSQLGVQGSYFFKDGGSYLLKNLHQFVCESYEVYRDTGQSMPSMPQTLPLIESAISLIKCFRHEH